MVKQTLAHGTWPERTAAQVPRASLHGWRSPLGPQGGRPLLRVIALALALCAASWGGAGALGVLGEARAAEPLPVHKRVLDNGMTVLVLPDHSIPSVALYLFYKVGSRNEQIGRTGLAHFFEHMMFNGSKKYPKGQFDRVMEAAGGSNNAFTTRDITVYTDWFPVTALDVVLDLEADRMANLDIAPAKVASEREVVLQERRLRTDGDPLGALDEQFNAAAYIAHPYRWPIIGWEADIRSWTQQDLEQFHSMFYAPNNAVLVLVGDLEPAEAFARVEQAFGRIPPGPAPREVQTLEPPQRGERRTQLKQFAQLPALVIGYHVPDSPHQSAATMKVLETLLMSGQSSRLYRRLVDRDQSALSVGGGYGEWNFDPTLFEFSVQLRGGHEPAAVEQAVYEELDRLRAEPPAQRELRKAKNIILANLYRRQKTNSGKALLLGVFEVIHGDHARLSAWAEAIEAVTPEMIQRFVQSYLVPHNRTVATLVPVKDVQPVEVARSADDDVDEDSRPAAAAGAEAGKAGTSGAQPTTGQQGEPQ